MSLYNLLHGHNPAAPLLLAMIDMDQPNGKWHSGRFRDVYLNEDGTRIILYTRNGGGNRQHWYDDVEPGAACGCPGCTIKYHLPLHPNFLFDRDDDFDCTYAYIEFSVPEQFLSITKSLSTGEPPKTIAEKFEATIQELKSMDAAAVESDPRFKPVAEVLKSILKAGGSE